MTAPKEAPETWDQIVAEMRREAEWLDPCTDDSLPMKVARAWRREFGAYASRFTAARERERAEQQEKIEAIAEDVESQARGLEHLAKRLREIV
jgi:hypothetical protein